MFQPKLDGVSELEARIQCQLQSDNFEQTNTKTKKMMRTEPKTKRMTVIEKVQKT
jgi:hypothetical protein